MPEVRGNEMGSGAPGAKIDYLLHFARVILRGVLG